MKYLNLYVGILLIATTIMAIYEGDRADTAEKQRDELRAIAILLQDQLLASGQTVHYTTHAGQTWTMRTNRWNISGFAQP